MHTKIFDLGSQSVKIETGLIAKQTDASVIVDIEGTVILATLVASKEDSDRDFFPLTVNYNEKTLQAAKDITEADIWLVGVPVYNSMFSAALKNIFEFVNYKETEGKTAGLTIVAGGMISFGDVQTLFTQLMSYFRVITNPTAVYLTGEKIVDGKITDDEIRSRLNEMVDKTLELAKRN